MLLSNTSGLINGDDLSNYLRPFQILDAINKGKLTPYDTRTGKKIVDESTLPREKLSLENILINLRIDEARIKNIYNCQPTPDGKTKRNYYRPLTDDEIKAKAELMYREQEGTPIVPDNCRIGCLTIDNVAHWTYKTSEVNLLLSEIDNNEKTTELGNGNLEAPAPQINPLANTDTEAEEFIQSTDDDDTFIRSLRIYYVSDQEIKIGTGGKPKVYTRKALGFEKASSAWRELLKIINSSNHLYYTGKAHGAYRQRKTTYDASQKTLRLINDKIVSFLNNTYPIQLSKGFKIYEHPVSERPGTYKFKFIIINNAEEEQTAEYDQCSQSELLKIIEDLSLNYGDKNSLKLAVSIAQNKKWLGENRAKSYLNGTIEK